MTDRVLNAIKMHAASMDHGAPVGRWGVVTGANGPLVKVLLQPEGVPTDWLPLLSSTVGGGWGMIHIPPNGTQVFCIPDAGDHNSYVVVGATWNVNAQAPGAAQGEVWLVHSTGSAIKLTNDGHVSISDSGGCSLAFTNNGTATLTGTLHISGDVIAGFGGADAISVQQHVHKLGTSTTTPPIAGT